MENNNGNEIRDMPKAEKEQPMLTMRRGGTTFLIAMHFAKTGKETLEDKAKRLISKDIQNENF